MERSEEQVRENLQGVSFDGAIFRVRVDPFSLRLAVEVRDAVNRSVKYHLLNLSEGKLEFSSPVMDWWTGLNGLSGNDLYLFHFEDPALPVQKGVEVRRIPDFDQVFLHGSAEWITDCKDGFLIVDEAGNGVRWQKDGSTTQIPSGEMARERERPEYRELSGCMSSVVRVPENGWSEVLTDSPSLDKHPPFHSIASILEENDRLLAAWHTQLPDGLFQLVLGFWKAGNSIWSKVISSDRSGLDPEPFFVIGDQVIWMPERNQLSWLTL